MTDDTRIRKDAAINTEESPMAVPKRKVSKSCKGMRRSHDHLAVLKANVCPNCNNSKLPHRVCPHCGWYNGKEVIAAKE